MSGGHSNGRKPQADPRQGLARRAPHTCSVTAVSGPTSAGTWSNAHSTLHLGGSQRCMPTSRRSVSGPTSTPRRFASGPRLARVPWVAGPAHRRWSPRDVLFSTTNDHRGREPKRCTRASRRSASGRSARSGRPRRVVSAVPGRPWRTSARPLRRAVAPVRWTGPPSSKVITRRGVTRMLRNSKKVRVKA
jgi:hypothetical protein